MWTDPIVDEVRRVREAYAKKFDYDLDRIFADLKKQQKKRLAAEKRKAAQSGSASKGGKTAPTAGKKPAA